MTITLNEWLVDLADSNNQLDHLAFADWLDEQGDDRAILIRCSFGQFRNETSAYQLQKISEAFGVFCSWDNRWQMNTILDPLMWLRSIRLISKYHLSMSCVTSNRSLIGLEWRIGLLLEFNKQSYMAERFIDESSVVSEDVNFVITDIANGLSHSARGLLTNS